MIDNMLPTPNFFEAGEGAFWLNSRARINYDDLFAPGAFHSAAMLRRFIKERFNLRLDMAPSSESKEKNAIHVGLLEDAAIAEALKKPGRNGGRLEHREGFRLEITPNSVTIGGFDSNGLGHGVQALLQCVERKGNGLAIPCCDIIDWPAHPFRGVHLYVPPAHEIPYFLRLIDYLAACRINTIILEIAAAMEFQRHPEFNRAWEEYAARARSWPLRQGDLQNYNNYFGRGKDSNHFEQGGGSFLSQSQMRRIVRYARQRNVRFVPEVQSPGHAYWMCLAHPEVAEWKNDKFPDTFCTAEPKSYELLFDAMEEVIDVFEPELMSTGNDEFYFYGICPRCRNKDGHTILADHLNRVNAWLRERGVKHLVWADKLINPRECVEPLRPEYGTGRMISWGGGERVLSNAEGEYVQRATWKAIDRIPDDILMADWYYGMSPDTEKYFAKHNKQVIWGNFNPKRFSEEPERLYAENVYGGELSTWIENGELSLAHSNWPLEAAMTADILWNEGYRKDELDRRMWRFMGFWRDQRNMLFSEADSLPSRDPCGFKSESIELPLQKLKTGMEFPAVKVARKDYLVPLKVSKQPLIINDETPSATINIDRPFRSIVFLQGVMVRAGDVQLPPLYDFGDYKEYFLSREIAALEFRAGDRVKHPQQGKRRGRSPIRLGLETGSILEPCGLTAISRPTFCDGILQEDGTGVFAWEWKHPNPENLVVHEIAIKRGRADISAPLVIYAATLIL